ncbi:MAG: SGNH/GDSL hydrolase family protein [Actinobacteria bacterium]|nr:SGNH/GDSL hydrolase family protein [Actinomycetota bacterium]
MVTLLRRLRTACAVALALIALTACLPNEPAAGRTTPVRRVLVLGDSLAYGLFFATPSATPALSQRLAQNNISLRLIGGPGGTVVEPWPGTAPWLEQLSGAVASFDPDVVIIQSTLFPDWSNPERQAAYRTAITAAYDIAQSRGAHTYIVAHHRGNDADARSAADTAERLQAEAAAGRGISTIPLTWWLDRCGRHPYIYDGQHLNAAGVGCYADALNAAVNQLRNSVG